MSTRQQVYEAIDSERDYQDKLFEGHRMENKTIGDYISVLRVYLRRADDSWTYDYQRNESPLDFLRKIAATGIQAMERLGAVRRTDGGFESFFIGPLPRDYVYGIIDGEREYQNNKWETLDERNSLGDFLTYMNNLQREIEANDDPDSPQEALDRMRKQTGVAVAAMEKFGAPHRQVPELERFWEIIK